ncbi:Nucleolar protein-like/EBNA1-binding protein [Ceraceosorus bombacis]|uniref:Nucleolar protein-like/EBNA1-binding protein n=1 Tax=Ceraceosorus bombacis TaxID=401625 RepID=A0A0P1BS45_9BASI|nr:Nucleolar protein-like/EBNA1-binding protein [Ceraceosorus bombacis]
MRRIRQDLSIDGGALGQSAPRALPWIEHMTVVYPQRIDAALAGVPDPANDDLKRELAFYKQALDAAIRGRRLCNQAGIPFDRPADFYAEQVKTDEHMERVRQRLLDESAGIKASEEAKRQRELKKFGKKVQVEKQLERQKSKRELNERIKGLKRKHEGALEGDDDDFDVRLETAIDGQERGRGPPSRGGRGQTRPKARMPRSARDAKYGFGGKKKQ